MADYTGWLRELAQKGGQGVVNNLDARCLGRIADELERLRAALQSIADMAPATSEMTVAHLLAQIAAEALER